jgi:hypothetical protein
MACFFSDLRFLFLNTRYAYTDTLVLRIILILGKCTN